MDEEHERVADELEHEAERMESRRDELGDEIDDAREGWDTRKSSEQVPGAAEPEAAAPGGLGEQDRAGDDEEGENVDAQSGGPA